MDEKEQFWPACIAVGFAEVYGRAVPPEARSKAQRRADREAVGAYHEAQLAQLLDHVREGFARYDAGAIDAFELDDVMHQYKRAARELWKACVGAGAHVEHMARLLEWQDAEGEEMDWWARGEPRRP